MKKPSNTAIKLYRLGWITSMSVDYRQTGTETADTFVILENGHGNKVTGLWSTYEEYLEVRVSHAYLAKLYQSYEKEVEQWLAFEKENEEELKEYQRLKAKFDG